MRSSPLMRRARRILMPPVVFLAGCSVLTENRLADKSEQADPLVSSGGNSGAGGPIAAGGGHPVGGNGGGLVGGGGQGSGGAGGGGGAGVCAHECPSKTTCPDTSDYICPNSGEGCQSTETCDENKSCAFRSGSASDTKILNCPQSKDVCDLECIGTGCNGFTLNCGGGACRVRCPVAGTCSGLTINCAQSSCTYHTVSASDPKPDFGKSCSSACTCGRAW